MIILQIFLFIVNWKEFGRTNRQGWGPQSEEAGKGRVREGRKKALSTPRRESKAKELNHGWFLFFQNEIPYISSG